MKVYKLALMILASPIATTTAAPLELTPLHHAAKEGNHKAIIRLFQDIEATEKTATHHFITLLRLAALEQLLYS